MPVRTRILLPLLLLVASACGGAPREGVRDMGDPATLTAVRITNQSWSDAVMYVMRETQRVRLGDVPAQGTRVFRIPNSMVSAVSLRFVADPVGSNRTASSYDISIMRGDTVTLTIPPTAF
jgi:hypothetical protein